MDREDKKEHLERSLALLMSKHHDAKGKIESFRENDKKKLTRIFTIDEDTRWMLVFIFLTVVFLGILAGVSFAIH